MSSSLPSAAGLVFNIQRFALQDGPGIRTTVFLKGCPLHCWWCSNPESRRPEIELALHRARCIGCRSCQQACSRGAISFADDRCRINRQRCDACLDCVPACPSRALEIVGRWLTIAEVMDPVLRDMGYYRRSQGGLTVSGGEPLQQWRFTEGLLREARRHGIHTALDTSGHADWDALAGMLRHTDLVLFDFKHLDADRHRQGTGLENRQIFENLERILTQTKIKVWIRYPLVPTFNDTDEAVAAACRYLRGLPRPVDKISLLPFHNLASGKYQSREEQYPAEELPLPPAERLRDLRALIEGHGFLVEIAR